VEADLHREYGLNPAEIAALSTREFLVLVGGLSRGSLFHEAYGQMPSRIDSAGAMASIFGELPPPPDN
jgi:hypothetical protein